MKKLLAKLIGKIYLSYNDKGILVKDSKNSANTIGWSHVNKIVFVDYFEEYSGYFLTEDYKNKVLYNDISVDCNRNIVKVRTGGAPSIKKNTSKPFSKQFGTTLINNVVFVEYQDLEGLKSLYAVHYEDSESEKLKQELKEFTKKDNIFIEQKIEGFSFIAEI